MIKLHHAPTHCCRALQNSSHSLVEEGWRAARLFRGSFATLLVVGWLGDCTWYAQITLLSFNHPLFSDYTQIFLLLCHFQHITQNLIFCRWQFSTRSCKSTFEWSPWMTPWFIKPGGQRLRKKLAKNCLNIHHAKWWFPGNIALDIEMTFHSWIHFVVAEHL